MLQAFGNFNLWLAAENGMFLRHTSGEWKTTMPEHLNMDWMDSVQVRNERKNINFSLLLSIFLYSFFRLHSQFLNISVNGLLVPTSKLEKHPYFGTTNFMVAWGLSYLYKNSAVHVLSAYSLHLFFQGCLCIL